MCAAPRVVIGAARVRVEVSPAAGGVNSGITMFVGLDPASNDSDAVYVTVATVVTVVYRAIFTLPRVLTTAALPFRTTVDHVRIARGSQGDAVVATARSRVPDYAGRDGTTDAEVLSTDKSTGFPGSMAEPFFLTVFPSGVSIDSTTVGVVETATLLDKGFTDGTTAGGKAEVVHPAIDLFNGFVLYTFRDWVL